MRRFSTREYYIPKHSTKVSDKNSDAVAYVYEAAGAPYAAIFWGKQAKPVEHYRYRTTEKREAAVLEAFKRRQKSVEFVANQRAERKAKSEEFRKSLEIGDIFHYSFGYDETHHVYYEVVRIEGKFATVRRISQAQEDLGYDWRHRCMPQSGEFIGPEERVLIQDGCIKVDRHYHAYKWNTKRVAGVPVGPSYQGGGCH